MKKHVFFLVLTIIFSLNVFGQKKEVEIISVSENKVVAVRKLIFSIEAADKIKQKTFIEIELEGNFNPEVSNCCDPHAFIDGVSFWLIRGTEGRFFIKMDQKTFKNLKNNSEIFASSVPPIGLNKIAEDYRDKRSSFMNGVSFGKLKKKLIKRFPAIKETQQSYSKRVWNAQ
jgi:hypothetical protein